MSRYTVHATSAKIGAGLLIGVLLLFVVLFSKDKIATTLMGGDTITATFKEDYKLRPDVSVVKVGYVKVGKVSGIERDEDGHAEVSLKVDQDVLRSLGSQPTATIRSTTLLGGSYFVDLQRGGDRGAFTARSIPVSRTDVPVELDRVARALQPDALEGVQGTLSDVDETLDARGQRALQRLMGSAPATLDPAARVLKAAQGDSAKDLTKVVTGLESASEALTKNDGQLDDILDGLQVTSSTFGQHSDDIATTLADLPSTLTTADRGLDDLDDTMSVVRDVADDTRPIVQRLDETLRAVNPVLKDARPVVRDARTLMTDAAPVVSGLVPAAKTADGVLDDVDGSVIKRLNGPVTSWLYEPYKGVGQYKLTSSKKTMYEEIVYMFSNLTRASTLADRNGHAVSFQPGLGIGSVNGLPVSPEQLFKGLTSWLWPESPLNTVEPITRPTTDGSGPGGTTPSDGAGRGDSKGSSAPTDLVKDIQGLLGGLGGGQ
ncbi:MAG: MCE family protein [Actinomycetales bacterium]|nr:MAG: MCE family protein [Actinomycetales bacterium]